MTDKKKTNNKKKSNKTVELGIIGLLLYILSRHAKAEQTATIDITVTD